jgi:hypothetical protein
MKNLEWTRRNEYYWRAKDETINYIARRDGEGIWRVTMNGVPIGTRDGFSSFTSAKNYVDWGGYPNRMGYDPETGEIQ